MSNPVPLIGPDGREYVLENPAELEHALSQGYREATAEAPRTLGEKTKAFGHEAVETLGAGAEGAVQGITGGLLGAVSRDAQREGEAPEDYARRHFEIGESKRRAAEHPLAAGVGEFAGMVASPINKIAAPIEGALGATSVLGRIAAKGVSNAAVGSLFGAGMATSEAALGDQDLTAEKLMAGAGLGAVLGFAGGGLGGAIEEGAAALLPKVGDAVSGAQDWLSGFAKDKALKAAGATKRDLDYLGADKAQEVGKTLLERGHLGKGAEAPNAREILASVSAEKEEVGQAIGKAFDAVHDAGLQPEYSKVLKRLDDFEAELSPLQRKAIAPEIANTKAAVLEYGGRAAGSEGSGFKALNELKKDLQSKAKWGDNVGNEFAGGLKRQLSGIVRDELDTQLGVHLGPDAAKQFMDAKKLYGVLSDAERVAEHGAERLGGNMPFGLGDLGWGSVVGHANPVAGLVSTIASKVMRDRGGAVVARLADQISKSPALGTIAASFGQQLQAAAPALGRYAAPVLQAYEHSPAEGLATHMTLAQVDPHYAEAAQAAGFTPESGPQHAAAIGKAQHLAGVAAVLDHQDQHLDKQIDAVFKGTKAPTTPAAMKTQDFGAKRMRKDSESAHLKRLEEVRQLAADPQALVDRVAGNMGNLGNHAPGVVAAVTKTANAAVQFLAQEAQQPPKAGPLAPDWVHSDAERHAFASVLETVQDPMSVLKHAAAGTLTEDQVRAFQTVYPTLARQVADKTLMKMAENPKAVPYRSRVMLSLLTGVDPDGTMSQEAIAANQAAIAAASSKPSNSMGTTKAGKSDTLTLANRTATPGQQHELKESQQ